MLYGIQFRVSKNERILVADKIRSYMAEPDSVSDIASDFMRLNVYVWARCNAR